MLNQLKLLRCRNLAVPELSQITSQLTCRHLSLGTPWQQMPGTMSYTTAEVAVLCTFQEDLAAICNLWQDTHSIGPALNDPVSIKTAVSSLITTVAAHSPVNRLAVQASCATTPMLPALPREKVHAEVKKVSRSSRGQRGHRHWLGLRRYAGRREETHHYGGVLKQWWRQEPN